MNTLLLFLVFPHFVAIPPTPALHPEMTSGVHQGNLISFRDSCRVREVYDLSYNDATIQNSLSGTDGVREFMVFYQAFPPLFTPEKQAELLSFLLEDPSKNVMILSSLWFATILRVEIGYLKLSILWISPIISIIMIAW